MHFTGLNNTRDLGGMQTKSGKKIKHGRLFRSGQLFKAKGDDTKILSSLGITKIIDLRTSDEIKEKPDPEVEGAQYIHLPVIKDLAAGITREQKADSKAVSAVVQQSISDPAFSLKYMCDMYSDFVTSDYTRAQYRKFIELLLENKSDTFLWHCTAGKDRAGFATIIAESLLGVPYDVMLSDYLLTNDHLAQEIEELIALYFPNGAPAAAEESVHTLFGAREEFLSSLFTTAAEHYGSFDAFLKNGIGITDAEKSALCDIYLE